MHAAPRAPETAGRCRRDRRTPCCLSPMRRWPTAASGSACSSTPAASRPSAPDLPHARRRRGHRRAGLAAQPALRRRALPHGRDAQLRPAAREPERHAARRHRAVGRAEAAADAGGAGRARAAATATGRWPRGCWRSARTSTSATTGCSRSRRCCTCANASSPTSTCSSSPSRRTALLRSPDRAGQPEARARHGRRRGRRHPALRAHDGRRRRERAHPVRARRRARPARRHALRRKRRPAVAPRRDAGLPHPAPRPARPRHRLAPDLDALDGQLLRVQAAAADARGAGCTRSPTR